MGFSYKPLWKLLIEKNLKKSELKEKVNISSATLAKMGKGENVSMDVIDRICTYLNCRVEEVIEFTNKKEKPNS